MAVAIIRLADFAAVRVVARAAASEVTAAWVVGTAADIDRNPHANGKHWDRRKDWNEHNSWAYEQ